MNKWRIWLCGAALGATACGDQDGDILHRPYEDGLVVITNDDDSMRARVTPDGCVETPNDGCLPVDGCDGPVDVILGPEVAETLCYGPDGAQSVVVNDSGAQQVSGSGSVVTFDPSLNGKELGAVVVSASESVLWGNGPGATNLASLTMSGSEARVRSVRVRGTTTLSGSQASLMGSTVEGDLKLSGSQAIVSDSYVGGDLSASGSELTLIRVGVGGSLTVSADGARCVDLFRWQDEDGDLYFHTSERGEELSCP